jgi:hypothetical protein
LKGITKQHQLYGKAKQQVLGAKSKQDLRDACQSVLECAEALIAQFKVLDEQRQITDNALQALYMINKQKAQSVMFVPSRSPLWRS